MASLQPKMFLRFQAKVLVPVITVMAALVIATVWVVNQRIVHQLETEGARHLETAEAVFQNSQKIHANGLLLRYRNIVNEPRFIAVSQLADPKTMQSTLTEMLDELNVDALVFTTAAGQRLASVSRDSTLKLTEFATDGPSIQQARQGQANAGISFAGERLFDVVSVPVNVDNSMIGVVTFGEEIGDAAAQEFRQLTHSEIAFLVNNHIVASTLPTAELRGPLESLLVDALPPGNGHATAGPAVRKAVVGDEHFLCSINFFPTATGRIQPAYVLLSSYEQPLRSLRDTQHVLVLVGILGVGLGSVMVWGLVRRVTRPLRQLRDSAEAVGRGDFSKRVAVASRDECGELAEAFNRMTQNLEASREQLEKTVDTLKSTKAQLTQSEKLSVIGEFVAGVAHELNNPLASVIGFSQLLQRGHFDTDQQHYVDRVARESQRCQKIVHNLLSFARQSQPERTWINLNQLLRSSLDILEYQLRTSNIEATTDLDPHLPGVMGDPHQLQQVFVNILNNARQAIEPHRAQGGRLRITSRMDAGRVQVLFSDNGPGIEEANLSKIFTPFFTTKEVGKGTGLGLSLCCGIVKEHGGSIRVESKLAEGATFLVDLPVAADAPAILQIADVSGTSTQAPARGTGKRVLVVDDEEALRDLLSVVLTADQYDVDTASDGDTALRKTRSAHYDLIVSDWKMPGLNGYEFYEQVRATNPQMAARFVFLTGDVIGAQKLLNNRDGTCLAKPFQVDELRATVNRLCTTS